jgi:hypothetical protein
VRKIARRESTKKERERRLRRTKRTARRSERVRVRKR